MKPLTATLAAACCAAAVAVLLPAQASAADPKPITNAAPASAASAPEARRTLQFNTRHDVAATLTSHRDAPITNGWKAQVRFGGQTDQHTCEFRTPKASMQVKIGETAVLTVTCTTPWQLYDNGLTFEAFEGDRKVADGTLRP